MLVRAMKKKHILSNDDNHLKSLISGKELVITIIISAVLGALSAFLPPMEWKFLIPLIPFVVLMLL